MALRIMRSADLADGQRVSRAVHGRTVTVLRHNGTVHCLDALCYHMGGPLGDEGDIEDLPAGGACIRCPWHKHRVCLSTGGKVEAGRGGLAVGAPVQRIHPAYDDGSYIMVAFNTAPLASDKYNDPCACAGGGAGAPAARAGGYGLGSLGAPGADARAPPGRPEPLLPYGGLDKYAPPPSPLKAPRAQGTLDGLRGRKLAAVGARGAAARCAVQYRYRPPPMAAGAGGAQATQTVVTDFFARRPASGPEDMEV